MSQHTERFLCAHCVSIRQHFDVLVGEFRSSIGYVVVVELMPWAHVLASSASESAWYVVASRGSRTHLETCHKWKRDYSLRMTLPERLRMPRFKRSLWSRFRARLVDH